MDFIDVKDYKAQKLWGKKQMDVQIINIETTGSDAPVTNLTYFVEPSLSSIPLDLFAGYKEHIHRRQPSVDRPMHRIEDFLISKYKNHPEINDINIYTKASVLRDIMVLPFHQKHPNYILKATKYGGKIYLNGKNNSPWEHVVDRRYLQNYKFRQYCSADSFNGQPDMGNPYDENKEMMATFRAKLQDINLLYTGAIYHIKSDFEITDLDDRNQLNQCKVVMSRVITEKHLHTYYSNYLAYLISANDIYYGVANIHGLVFRPIQQFTLKELEKHQKWSIENCLAFLYKFLKDLKCLMADTNCPYTTYVFNMNDEMIRYEVHEGKSENSFLSEEFINFLKQQHH